MVGGQTQPLYPCCPGWRQEVHPAIKICFITSHKYVWRQIHGLVNVKPEVAEPYSYRKTPYPHQRNILSTYLLKVFLGRLEFPS